MTLLRRAWHGLEHYRLTAITVALALAVVLLFIQTERNAADVRTEAAARTLQSCTAAAEARSAVRKTFVAIFDLFDAQAKAAGQPEPPGIVSMREIVNRELPELTCPTDQGPIVIPTPSSTTVPPPSPASNLPESSP